jgi:asparagine synthase (glutamine-hydrolysing)
MCGIVGVAAPRAAVSAGDVVRMNDTLRHRGPDDEGYLAVSFDTDSVIELSGRDSQVQLPRIESIETTPDLVLGHRRLSVVDISPAGHQPMSSHDGERWIVYNGEIYNHDSLRERLRQCGRSFTSLTDTEVVLAAYEQWGVDCVDHLDGMWAFVIYDHRERKLFGARDRFGVKPLYFAFTDEFFGFASEIKALLDLPFVDRRLNRGAVFEALVFAGLTSSDEDLFDGIVELMPAHAFTLDLKAWRLDRWRYYDLQVNRGFEAYRPERAAEYADQVRELLTDSVRRRMRADVPLGTCLSGGIDSSSLVCLGDRLLRDNQRFGTLPDQQVFSACYPQPDIDERRWAEMVVRTTEASWHQVFPTADDMLEDIEELAYHHDLPFMSPSQYSQFRVMGLARERGMTVLLDGQGGDELFTGYSLFYEVFLYELLAHGDVAGFVREWWALEHSPMGRRSGTLALMKQIRRHALPYRFVLAHRRRRKGPLAILAPEFWSEHRDRWELLHERDFGSLNDMLFELFSRQKLGHLLRYEDRSSMRFSIESRTPLADDRALIEMVFGVPGRYKIHDGWSKKLLRDAMRGIVPDEILGRRDKKGFATPARQWLDEMWPSLRSTVDDELRDVIDPKLLREGLWPWLANHGQAGLELMWRCVSFAVWRRVFKM